MPHVGIAIIAAGESLDDAVGFARVPVNHIEDLLGIGI